MTKLTEDMYVLEDSRKQLQSEFVEIERRKQEIKNSEKKIGEKQTQLHEMAENLSQFSKFLKLKEENAQDKLFWANALKVDTEKAFTEVVKQKQEIENEKLAFTNQSLELKKVKKAIIQQRIILLDERSKSRTLEKPLTSSAYNIPVPTNEDACYTIVPPTKSAFAALQSILGKPIGN